jgi:hypothetical protein
MPSPFSGIDPYLEAPELWEDVHANLATEIRAQLQPQLVPRYVAALTPYVTYEDIIIGEPATIKPDVAVMQQREAPRPTMPAVGAVPAPILGVTALAEPEVPAKAQRIEIRTVGDQSLVTVIEILSPSNKRLGTESFEAYQRKRRDLLRSNVHLLELDLLRRGVRWPLETPLPDAPGFVFLSRAEQRPTVAIWPLTFRDPLPPIPVPLRLPDADVTIDLATALGRVYEQGAYALRIDYRKDPPAPAFSAADAEWLDARLRGTGVR